MFTIEDDKLKYTYKDNILFYGYLNYCETFKLEFDEAIAQINYNGSNYSAAIFTSNSKLASKFIKEVKSKIVTVNTSPTIERIMDIKQLDLCNEKIIVYPNTFKFDERISMNLNN